MTTGDVYKQRRIDMTNATSKQTCRAILLHLGRAGTDQLAWGVYAVGASLLGANLGAG